MDVGMLHVLSAREVAAEVRRNAMFSAVCDQVEPIMGRVRSDESLRIEHRMRKTMR